MSKKINQQFNCSKMMLPEHCGQLREHSAGLKIDSQKAFVETDEQLLEEWQQIFDLAFAKKLPLTIVYNEAGEAKTVTGTPSAVKTDEESIAFKPGNAREQKILVKAILGLRLCGNEQKVT